MKVKASIKKRSTDCKIVRRNGKLYIINNMAHFYQIGFKGFDLRTNRYLFQEIFTILDSIDHQIFLNSKF